MENLVCIRLFLVMLFFIQVASLTCDDGDFLDGDHCSKCPYQCQFCVSKESCLSCITGYWGNACENSCSRCKDGTSCEKTTGFCLDSCKPGYTGAQCDSKYNEKCSSCDRTNAQTCLNCALGRYPPNSYDKSCPSSCNNQTCNASDFCISGCTNGYWGRLCNESCAENCRESLCFQVNGTCILGEEETHKRKYTVICDDGYFLDGNHCSKCPDQCQFCYSKELCLSCITGYWGNACEHSCSRCKDGTSCEKTTGFCLGSCKPDYTGAQCYSKCNEKCSSCDRTNAQTCLNCGLGRYPPNSCDKYCPSSCNNQTCNASDFCISGCTNGYWGRLCSESCAENCRESSCFQVNGTCILGEEETHKHKPEFYGGNNKEMWLIGLLAVSVAVIALLTIYILRSQRQTENQQSSTMHQASEYMDVTNLQERAYAELNDELREQPSSSTYTPLGLTDEYETVIDNRT